LRPSSLTFSQFLSSVQGDLSNITAPPQFLAPSSVVEVGHCWAQRPAIFAAPAQEADPKKRSLLVLKLVLTALKSQLYVAGSPTVSIKKPLNAFLGEVFAASWTDSKTGSTTKLRSEQVSHHVNTTRPSENDIPSPSLLLTILAASHHGDAPDR
jgi:oxysterol-binding protein-related protein 9/10/11